MITHARPVLPIDPQRVDETNLPWAFLSDATRPELVVPGEFLVVGTDEGPLLATVVDVVAEDDDAVVHVQVHGPAVSADAAIHAAAA